MHVEAVPVDCGCLGGQLVQHVHDNLRGALFIICVCVCVLRVMCLLCDCVIMCLCDLFISRV